MWKIKGIEYGSKSMKKPSKYPFFNDFERFSIH
jgi:hypothetical protein